MMKPKTNLAAKNGAGYDQCQTPPYALTPLLPFLHPSSKIWEPACGEGSLVTAMKEAGLQVQGTDWLTGHDYFEYEPDDWDLSITNPPYSLKYKWLERSYELRKPFALLVPLEMLGAASCQRLIKINDFRVMLLDKRVNFKMPNKGYSGGGTQFPVMWLCNQILPDRVTFGSIEK